MSEQGVLRALCVSVCCVFAMTGCGPLLLSSELQHGTQSTRLSFRITENPRQPLAEAQVRIRKGNSLVRLDQGERIYVNDTQLVRKRGSLLETMVADIPIADTYKLSFYGDEEYIDSFEIASDGIPRFEITEAEIVESGDERLLIAKVEPKSAHGNVSQRARFEQHRGEAGVLWSIASSHKPDDIRIDIAEPAYAPEGVEPAFLPGHALLRVNRTHSSQDVSLENFERVSVIIDVNRELAVRVPDSFGE